MQSLLEKAKSCSKQIKSQSPITEELFELAMGYYNGEVGLKQVAIALGSQANPTVYILLTRAIRWGIENKRIEIRTL